MIFNDFRKRHWQAIKWQITLGPTRHIESWKLRRAVNGFLVPFYLLANLSRILSGRFVFPHVVVTITKKCTLNCEACIALYPAYRERKEKNVPTEELSAVIDRILASTDGVHAFSLGGGEPFLHPELATLLNQVTSSEKVEISPLYTTGMPVPKRETLQALANPKVFVGVSHYGDLSRTLGALQEAFDAAGVRYRIEQNDWTDFGSFEKRHSTEAELERRFTRCWARTCMVVTNGELHFCYRSANGMDTGQVPRNPDDYVDLMAGTPSEVRQRMKDFLKKPYISACDHCDGAGKLSTIRGVQV